MTLEQYISMGTTAPSPTRTIFTSKRQYTMLDSIFNWLLPGSEVGWGHHDISLLLNRPRPFRIEHIREIIIEESNGIVSRKYVDEILIALRKCYRNIHGEYIYSTDHLPRASLFPLWTFNREEFCTQCSECQKAIWNRDECEYRPLIELSLRGDMKLFKRELSLTVERILKDEQLPRKRIGEVVREIRRSFLPHSGNMSPGMGRMCRIFGQILPKMCVLIGYSTLSFLSNIPINPILQRILIRLCLARLELSGPDFEADTIFMLKYIFHKTKSDIGFHFLEESYLLDSRTILRVMNESKAELFGDIARFLRTIAHRNWIMGRWNQAVGMYDLSTEEVLYKSIRDMPVKGLLSLIDPFPYPCAVSFDVLKFGTSEQKLEFLKEITSIHGIEKIVKGPLPIILDGECLRAILLLDQVGFQKCIDVDFYCNLNIMQFIDTDILRTIVDIRPPTMEVLHKYVEGKIFPTALLNVIPSVPSEIWKKFIYCGFIENICLMRAKLSPVTEMKLPHGISEEFRWRFWNKYLTDNPTDELPEIDIFSNATFREMVCRDGNIILDFLNYSDGNWILGGRYKPSARKYHSWWALKIDDDKLRRNILCYLFTKVRKNLAMSRVEAFFWSVKGRSADVRLVMKFLGKYEDWNSKCSLSSDGRNLELRVNIYPYLDGAVIERCSGFVLMKNLESKEDVYRVVGISEEDGIIRPLLHSEKMIAGRLGIPDNHSIDHLRGKDGLIHLSSS